MARSIAANPEFPLKSTFAMCRLNWARMADDKSQMNRRDDMQRLKTSRSLE
jgi:hypothetical protein